MSESVTADENGWFPIGDKLMRAEYSVDLPRDAISGIGFALDDAEEISFLVWWTYRGNGVSETTHWRPLPAGPVSLTPEA